jgi:acyl-CoA thioesterase I
MSGVKVWGLSIAMAGVVLGAVGLGAVGEDAQASLSQRCRVIHQASELRHAQVTGAGARVAVIGDSYAQGLRLDRPRESWPSQLDGEVVVDGFAGSGFSRAASPCGRVSFGDRVGRALASAPDLVVVQGGLNDVDVPLEEVAEGARALLGGLAEVPSVVVGPPAAPRRGAAAAEVDALLATVAAEAGVPYVRTYDWALDYLPDRLHLTPAGHQEFGDRVADAIQRLG